MWKECYMLVTNSLWDYSYLEVINSDLIRSFKMVGGGEGCPGRYHPSEFAQWKKEQNVKMVGRLDVGK